MNDINTIIHTNIGLTVHKFNILCIQVYIYTSPKGGSLTRINVHYYLDTLCLFFLFAYKIKSHLNIKKKNEKHCVVLRLANILNIMFYVPPKKPNYYPF